MHSEAEIILEALKRKQAKNSSYSLRALARDCGVSHSFLSLIANGKKKMPRHLELILTENKIVPVKKKQKSTDEYFQLSLDQFHLISKWYHFALLELLTLKNAKTSPQWLSKKIGVPLFEVKLALERLERLGYLSNENGLKVCTPKSSVKPKKADLAVRLYHTEMLEKARVAMLKTAQSDFEKREISGMTLAINKEKLPLAKKKINKFKREMAKLLCDDQTSDVYQLSVQFFSLLNKEK